jgi:hypothetical protein
MFPAKWAKTVEALAAAFADRNRGDVITWDEIETVAGMHREERGGWTVIKGFRRHLRRDREIVTLPSTDVGLRLLTHQEAAKEVPALRTRKAYRQISRGLRETATVDPGQLSTHEAKRLALMRASMKEQRLTIGRAARDAKASIGGTFAMPRAERN